MRETGHRGVSHLEKPLKLRWGWLSLFSALLILKKRTKEIVPSRSACWSASARGARACAASGCSQRLLNNPVLVHLLEEIGFRPCWSQLRAQRSVCRQECAAEPRAERLDFMSGFLPLISFLP